MGIGKALTKEETSMVAFPEDRFSSGHIFDPYRQINTYIMGADFNQIRADLADFMNGIWP